jgi:type I restriction-modification system DNA methylase subunit
MSTRKGKSNREKLVGEICSLGQSCGLNHAFCTFLEILATCLSVEIDSVGRQERKARYEQIMAELDEKTSSAYTRMCALMYLVVQDHKDEPCDILGSIFHELNLSNEWNGQYFSPDDICRLMGSIAIAPDTKTLQQPGLFTVSEPTCGSGGMVLGAVWAMARQGIDYQHQVLFVAQDIDIRCVWMAYIQLYLYRIPAVVIHGDTLLVEEWSHWFTPYAIHLCAQLSESSEDEEPGSEEEAVI